MAFTTIKAKSKNRYFIDFNIQQIIQVYLLETIGLFIKEREISLVNFVSGLQLEEYD